MTWQRRLSRGATRLEAALDRIWPKRGNDRPPVIDPYLGYASGSEIVLRGRVLTALRRSEPRPEQGRLTNLRQMVNLFLTDEVEGVRVRARGQSALSDEEGYFTLPVPRREGERGWIEIPLEGDTDTLKSGKDVLRAFIPGPDARFGVISDIDDTLLETGAWRRSRMAWTSLTGNILTRRIFPDAIELLTRLNEDGRNPVFYVSSSPWNLHDFLARLFQRNGLVDGPMFLRDLGIAEDQLITAGHGDHKGGAIDVIMAANPDLPFVLVGDTGQHDAQIYEAATRRHEGRIRRVILRAPGRGADPADHVHIRQMRTRGVTVDCGPTFAATLEALTVEA